MREYTASEARNNFADVVNEAAYGLVRVVINKQGKKIVAVVPYSDLELLEFLETRIDIEEAKQALEESKTQDMDTLQNLKAALGKD